MDTRLFARRSLLSLAFVVAPLAAQAQETQLFTWTGRVDREVRLTVRGNQMSNSAEANMQTRGRFFGNTTLPLADGTVRVALQNGRGNVDVIQQPNSGNGYTAIVRVVDNDGGADNYRIAAYFTPAYNGGYANGSNNGRGYGRNDKEARKVEREREKEARKDDRRDGVYRDRNDSRINSPTLHWSGDVDGEAQIIWRPGSVSQRSVRGNTVRVQNSAVSGSAMTASQYGQLTLNVRQSRGRVEVVQQPTAQNRYTGIIRILDGGRGYSHYDFDATWQ